MVLFKINGERNSGTNFLHRLLLINGFPVFSHNIKNKVCYHWKHKAPNIKLKKKNNNLVDIFIFRNLNDWLISMYKNPYHLKRINNFNNFLTKKQMSSEKKLLDHRTKKCLNLDDNYKTIFEIRYYKFHKIWEYQKENKNIVFVNLSFLQNKENALLFLKELNDRFLGEKINYITEITNHTKNKKNIKNREYNINIIDYQKIIDYNKDQTIESFIDNLRYQIYK